MRGKAFGGIHVVIRQRITPAYAGKSMELSSSIMVLKDHPRLCGEKLYSQLKLLGWNRITPAYAGKSLLVVSVRDAAGDHPRLCGEKTKSNCPLMQILGSPPPMRGKVAFEASQNASPRITPAYAGKSIHMPPKMLPSKDHPRLCGEKTKLLHFCRRSVGSPPPMRGKARVISPADAEIRITPAYAGKR